MIPTTHAEVVAVAQAVRGQPETAGTARQREKARVAQRRRSRRVQASMVDLMDVSARVVLGHEVAIRRREALRLADRDEVLCQLDTCATTFLPDVIGGNLKRFCSRECRMVDVQQRYRARQ